MNDSTVPMPTPVPQSKHRVLVTLCQAALWFLIAIKALWLAMVTSDLHFVSPIPLFCLAFAVLLAATIAFQRPMLVLALVLSWVGVILGYVAGHISGVVPGPMTNRIHEQMLYHWADIAYLVFAHITFFVRCASPARAR